MSQSEPPERSEAYTYELDVDETVSQGVVAAVAAVTDSDPAGPVATDGGHDVLDPLWRAVDPDALDALFRPTGGDRRSRDSRVEFTFNGQRVTVLEQERIRVRPAESV